MKTLALAIPVVLALLACKSGPSAMEACKELERAGVAANCHPHEPGGLWSSAVEGAEFSLVAVPGEGGYVMKFGDTTQYDRVALAFAKVSFLVGPHQYGNRDKLIFTQFNEGASRQVGQSAKTVIAGL